MIVIVDYGLGNLNSISNMLKRIGAPSVVSREPSKILEARKLILPGVGAFDAGMRNLAKFGLREVLDEAVLNKGVPVLGVCLGMQLLTRRSEEGVIPGLGWIAGEAVRFVSSAAQEIKIPHMGWNFVQILQRSHPLCAELGEEPRFYFAHSYHVICEEPHDVFMTTAYGIQFPSVIGKKNIFGAQFHPEKSHSYGMRLLRNFARMDTVC